VVAVAEDVGEVEGADAPPAVVVERDRRHRISVVRHRRRDQARRSIDHREVVVLGPAAVVHGPTFRQPGRVLAAAARDPMCRTHQISIGRVHFRRGRRLLVAAFRGRAEARAAELAQSPVTDPVPSPVRDRDSATARAFPAAWVTDPESPIDRPNFRHTRIDQVSLIAQALPTGPAPEIDRASSARRSTPATASSPEMSTT
jgi:hypothetical protein